MTHRLLPGHRQVDGPARVAAAAAGLGLGVVFGVTARIRRSKPLHPLGVLRHGVLAIEAPGDRTGVPLLDEVGEHPCLVRMSRATGLPAPLPDIHGLALRLTERGDVSDLLFAGTGDGRLGRFLLVPRFGAGDGPLTTLLPMRAPTGALLLGVFPEVTEASGEPPQRYAVRSARATTGWVHRGTLRLGAQAEQDPDPPLRFDTVLHPLPGLEHYPVIRLLREPAYSAARRGWRSDGGVGHRP